VTAFCHTNGGGKSVGDATRKIAKTNQTLNGPDLGIIKPIEESP